MRQIGAEKDDPLKRIQAEISEVERRERELREKKLLLNGSSNGFISTTSDTSSSSSSDGSPSSMTSTLTEKDQNNDSVLSTMSDDSGISSSSSPINGQSSNRVAIPKYVRSFTIQNTTSPSTNNSKMPLTRAMSTPQIFVPAPKFHINSATKGIMQRFIATHGRVPASNGTTGKDGISMIQNENGKMNEETFTNGKSNILTSAELNRAPIFLLPTEIVSPPKIERDEEGRPVRRGFVPVEEKIQKELRDLRTRESELKRLRREHRLRQSQPDLLNSLTNSPEYDSGEESEEEHCFMPGKLRSTKSIGELCDVMNNSSPSSRYTPSPQYQRNSDRNSLKPAVSLAQLCDVDPEQAPSSHRLIAQWETIIQKNL